MYLRWWMHEESYQAITAAINLTATHVVSHCVTRPAMAWNFVAMADAAFWTTHFEGVNFARIPEADFEVEGRHSGVFAHDWRVEPPLEWIQGARTPMPFAARADGMPVAPALSEAEFRRALRDALRDYTRPDRLADSPLRFVRSSPGVQPAAEAGAMVQQLLREAAGALHAHPRDAKFSGVIRHTYFEPLENQERVAERLNLPFSTYRHHLGRGIDRLTAWLWHRYRSGLSGRR